MADLNTVHVQSRQPIVAIDTSATQPALALDTDSANTIQPISIPGSASATTTTTTATGSATSPTSPSKSYGKKTGTRSTFCPNTLRKGTKLTEEDYEHHEGPGAAQAQPTGWLQMLGLKKNANFGDPIDSSDEPHHQSYY